MAGGLFGQIQPVVPKPLPVVSKPSKLPIVVAWYEKNVSDWHLVVSRMIMWKISLKSQIFLNWKKKSTFFLGEYPYLPISVSKNMKR